MPTYAPFPANFTVPAVPPNVQWTWQDAVNFIFAALNQGTYIEGGGFVVRSPTAPTSDQGLWMPPGSPFVYYWDTAHNAYFPVNWPAGMIFQYSSDPVPPNSLPCDGSTCDAAAFPRLDAIIGGNVQTYSRDPGDADALHAANQFKLPDYRSRFPVGAGGGYANMDGTGPLTPREIGQRGGKEQRAANATDMPSPLNVTASEFATTANQSFARLYGGFHWDNTDGRTSVLDASNGGYTIDAGANPGGGSATRSVVPPFLATAFMITY